MLVEAILNYPDVVEEALIATAFLSTQSPFILPPGEEMEARRRPPRLPRSRGRFRLLPQDVPANTRNRETPSSSAKKATSTSEPCSRSCASRNRLELIVPDIGVPIVGGGTHGGLPVRRQPRSHTVRLRPAGPGHLPHPDGRARPDTSELGHVQGESPLHRCRRDRAHDAHVRHERFASAEALAYQDLSSSSRRPPLPTRGSRLPAARPSRRSGRKGRPAISRTR